MFDLFKEELDSSTFESYEDYKDEVQRVTTRLEEELGRVERLLLNASQSNPGIIEDLDISIKS